MFDSTFSKVLAGLFLLNCLSTNKRDKREKLEEQDQRETQRLLDQAEKDLQEMKAMIDNFEKNKFKLNSLSELSSKEKEIKSKEKPSKHISFWNNFINKLK